MPFIIKVKPRIERPEGRHRERRNKGEYEDEKDTTEDTGKEVERLEMEKTENMFFSVKLVRLCWSG